MKVRVRLSQKELNAIFNQVLTRRLCTDLFGNHLDSAKITPKGSKMAINRRIYCDLGNVYDQKMHCFLKEE